MFATQYSAIAFKPDIYCVTVPNANDIDQTMGEM